MSNIPNSNLPTNLPVPINTLDSKDKKSDGKIKTIFKNFFVKNFTLKISSLAISMCLWVLYKAFL